jgi:hypothetical protein
MAEYITHEDARQLVSKYKANAERLKSCRRHQFQPAGGRFCCTTCGGVVTDDQRRWYEQGVEHGKQAGVVKKKT